MVEGKLPSKEEVESYIRERNNWGQWGMTTSGVSQT